MNLKTTLAAATLALACSAVPAAFAQDRVAAPAVQPASDVSGTYTWEGGMGGGGGNATTTLVLKQDGNKLTGTITGRGGETAIENGTVEGNAIKFAVTRDWNGTKVVTEYSGTLSGSDLKLTQTTKREIDAKKSA